MTPRKPDPANVAHLRGRGKRARLTSEHVRERLRVRHLAFIGRGAIGTIAEPLTFSFDRRAVDVVWDGDPTRKRCATPLAHLCEEPAR